MNFYWEDASKRLQQELNDPLLRVEFNSKNQTYEILKLVPNYNIYSIPGGLVGSSQSLVHLSIASGRWSYQMGCKEWDNRIFERMRNARLDNKEFKYITYNRKTEKEKVTKRQENIIHEASVDTAKDLWKIEHPKVYSCPT